MYIQKRNKNPYVFYLFAFKKHLHMKFIFRHWTPPHFSKSIVLSEVDFAALNSDKKPSITYCSLYILQHIAPCLMAVSKEISASFFRVDVTSTVKEDSQSSTQSLINLLFLFFLVSVNIVTVYGFVLLEFDCQRRQRYLVTASKFAPASTHSPIQ